MAHGCPSDDCRDRQQWHAFITCSHFCCWNRARCPPYHISRFACSPSTSEYFPINISLGTFALYTAFVLVDFKTNHPEVHNMGDAGKILGGSILREILAAGTVIFAVCATGSQLLAGQISLGVLSDNRLCLMLATGKDRPGT